MGKKVARKRAGSPKRPPAKKRSSTKPASPGGSAGPGGSASPAGASSPVVESVDVSTLLARLDPQNARRQTQASRAALAESIGSLGLGRSVVMDADGVIRAGNGTLQAALEAGIKRAVIVRSDGSQVVAVKREDLRGERARAYALADNRTAELSEWDGERLKSAAEIVAEAGIDLSGSIGFTADELDAAIAAGMREAGSSLASAGEAAGDRDPAEAGEGGGEKNPHREFDAGDQSAALHDKFELVVWCDSAGEREALVERMRESGRTARVIHQA